MANVSYWMLTVRERGKRNEPVRLYLPQRDTEIVREGNRLGMLSVVGEGNSESRTNVMMLKVSRGHQNKHKF